MLTYGMVSNPSTHAKIFKDLDKYKNSSSLFGFGVTKESHFLLLLGEKCSKLKVHYSWSKGYLEPQLVFAPNSQYMINNEAIIRLTKCISSMMSDSTTYAKIFKNLDKYKNSKGLFHFGVVKETFLPLGEKSSKLKVHYDIFYSL